MAIVTTEIGSLPVSRGQFVAGTTYYKHNIVQYIGSAYESVIDNNTTVPAVLNKDGNVTVNAGWRVFADAAGIYKMQADVNRLNETVFPLSVSVTGGGVFEKGTTQTITVNWVVKRGNDVVSADSVLVNGQAVTGNSKTFSGVTTNTTYKVDVTKDGMSKSASTSARFVNPSYLGVVSNSFTPSESAIKGLSKAISESKWRSLTGATLVNQKVCYAYPKAFGALASIKDANNFDYINSYQRTELNINGEAYYVYVMKDAASITNFKQIFA